MSEEQNKQKDNKALHIGGVMLINGWKIYTPEDDECVVVIEDSFETKKTMDVDDFVKMLEVIHSVQDY